MSKMKEDTFEIEEYISENMSDFFDVMPSEADSDAVITEKAQSMDSETFFVTPMLKQTKENQDEI